MLIGVLAKISDCTALNCCPTDTQQKDKPDLAVSSPPPQWHAALCAAHCQQDAGTFLDSGKMDVQTGFAINLTMQPIDCSMV